MPPDASGRSLIQNDCLVEPLLSITTENSHVSDVAATSTTGNLGSTTTTSRNVTLTLIYTVFAYGGRSMWSQSVLTTFVYLLQGGNPEAVGYITAVMGLSQLVTSFPTGYIADRHRRDSLLRMACVLGIVAIGLSLLAIRQLDYRFLVVALAAWGCYWGIVNTALSALYADSIRTGDRSYYFTKRQMLVALGNTTGPLASLIMFAVLGDRWTTRDCAIVMSAGQIACFPAVLLLCLFRDDLVEEARETWDMEGEEEPDMDAAEERGFTDKQNERCVEDDSSSLPANEEEMNLSVGPTTSTVCGCIPEKRSVAILIAMSDLISRLGSGMTIRYFPLFFVDNLGLKPVSVQVLSLVSPLTNAGFMRVSQRLSKRFGRCHVSASFRLVGIALMFVMIAAYYARLPTWCVCTIHVFRFAFMNSTGALTKSVLMDTVPRNERGKWSALESINMFSWSGSSAVGGFLVSLLGSIVPLFAVTAGLQLLGTLPLVFLFSRDAIEENESSDNDQHESVDNISHINSASTQDLPTIVASSPGALSLSSTEGREQMT